MKYGFCSWLLTGKLQERIRFIAESGFNSVSLLQSVMSEKTADRLEAARIICDHDLTVTYHGNVHDHLLPGDKLDSDYVKRVLDDVLWWKEQTGRVYSCLSDSIHKCTEKPLRLIYFHEETRALFEMETEIFRGTGIRYGIENFFTGNSYSSLPELINMRSLVEKTPESGMLLDIGHANIFINKPEAGGISLKEYIEQLPFRIHEVHISDNFGKLDEHLPPGKGSADYRALRSALKKRGENPVITLEFCPDILRGKYCWDIGSEEERKIILDGLACMKKVFQP